MGDFVNWPSCGDHGIAIPAAHEGDKNLACFPPDEEISLHPSILVPIPPLNDSDEYIAEYFDNELAVLSPLILNISKMEALPLGIVHGFLYYTVSIILNILSQKTPLLSPEIAGTILERIGKPYSPKGADKIYLGDLKTTANTTEAMDRLITEYKLSPDKALEIVVKHVLTYQPKRVKNTFNATKQNFGIERRDLEILTDPNGKYRLTYGQVRVAIEVASDEVGKNSLGVKLLDVLNSVFHTVTPKGEISLADIDVARVEAKRSITLMQDKLMERYGNATVAILESIVAELQKGDLSGNKLTFELGAEKITIDLSLIPQENRQSEIARCVRIWKLMIESLRAQSGLPYAPVGAQGPLADLSPRLDQLKELSGVSLENMIRARHQGEALLVRALDPNDPTARALRRFLFALNDSPLHVFGLTIAGETPQVVRLLNGQPQRSYVVNSFPADSAAVGPYTFYKTANVVISASGALTYRNALLMVDRRGQPSIVSQTEMQKLREAAHALTHDPALRGFNTDAKRSFFKFFNDMQAAWLSVFKKGDAGYLEPVEGTPETVRTMAKDLAKLGYGYELLREIRMREKNLFDMKGSLTEKKYEELVRFNISGIIKNYQDHFPTEGGARKKFISAVKQLEQAILAGKRDESLRLRAIIKHLTFRSMDVNAGSQDSRYKGNVRTWTFGAEVKEWISIAKKGLRNAAPETLERIRLYRPAHDGQPSIAEAKKLTASGKFEDAMAEYERVSIDPSVNMKTRASALTEILKIAYFSEEAPVRMNKAIAELAYLVQQGHKLSADEKGVIKSCRGLEASGIVTIPKELLLAAEEKTGLSTAYEMVNRSLTDPAIERSGIPLNERTALLNPKAHSEIEKLVANARGGELSFFDVEELRQISTMTEWELERYVSAKEVIKGPIEVLVRDLHSKARSAVIKYGYQKAMLKAHQLTASIADSPADSFDPKTLDPVGTGKGIELAGETVIRLSPPTFTRPSAREALHLETPLELRANPWLFTARDIATHTVLGVGSFVAARKIVDQLLPEPERAWEMMLQGYATMGTAMLIDRLLSGACSDTSFFTIPTGSLTEMASGIGSAVILSRFITGTAQIMGMEDQNAEWAGLIGMAAVMGGYRPVVRAISPAVYRDIVTIPSIKAQFEKAGVRMMYASRYSPMLINAGTIMNRAGLYYFAADATLGVMDSVVDLAVDDISSMARDIEYAENMRWIYDRSFAGDNKDTGVLDKLYYSVLYSLDSMVPPALFKLTNDIFETQRRREIKANLEKEWADYKPRYEKAVGYMIDTMQTAAMAFGDNIGKALMEEDPPPISEILQRMISSECFENSEALYESFRTWQKYADDNLRRHDRMWLFEHDFVYDGFVNNSSALTYWLKNVFVRVLNIAKENLRMELSAIENADSDGKYASAALAKGERLLETLERYDEEIEDICDEFENDIDFTATQVPIN